MSPFDRRSVVTMALYHVVSEIFLSKKCRDFKSESEITQGD